MELDEMLGKRVTLRGTAYDAHAGAVLMLPDGITVYVSGLSAWDEQLYGREVELTGVLNREQLGPEPTVTEDGHTHGMVGRPLVLREASWQAV